MAELTINVNGQLETVHVESEMPLLWVLRDVLDYKGTKFGCGLGQCGCCTVLLDGEATRACLTAISSVGEREVTTIESLAAEDDHPIVAAWQEENTAQCGYCQAGQMMSAKALLATNPSPSDAEINNAMSGNLCRCGTYKRIRKSIRRAARALSKGQSES